MNTKILDASHVRHLDQLTIENQHIRSIRLMERAAYAFVGACDLDSLKTQSIYIFAGVGNNGGDALAISRLLLDQSISNTVYLCHFGSTLSKDCQINLARLSRYSNAHIQEINTGDKFPDCEGFVIDGIFGSGLNRAIENYWADLISYINHSAENILSIDIPSGMYADKPTNSVAIENADVISFDSPKLSFLLPDSQAYIKSFKVVDIGLDTKEKATMPSDNYIITEEFIQSAFTKRQKFSHKGIYGKACIVGGSDNMIGAVLLSGKAALASGCGYVYYHVPETKKNIILQNHPEGIIEQIVENIISMTCAIGPALGQDQKAITQLYALLDKSEGPVILDADALNILSMQKKPINIPENSILTPHPKEFERLFGPTKNSFSQLKKLREQAINHKCYICLKGAHTIVADPNGDCFFNTTGNPGMAVAGSGDVLTGIITSFLAQKFSPANAAMIGVYIHGIAGDLAAQEKGEYGMTAQDIIDYIPEAIKSNIC